MLPPICHEARKEDQSATLRCHCPLSVADQGAAQARRTVAPGRQRGRPPRSNAEPLDAD
jgi:hypothetical protein